MPNKGQIIDGKLIASKLRQQIAEEVDLLKKKHNIIPALHVILVGDNGPSHIYVNNKRLACQQVGIESVIHHLKADTTQQHIAQLIEELNNRPDVHGVLVQLPLPGHINTQDILQAISPLKDVDGLHPYNLGLLFMGDAKLIPCTPQGCMHLIQSVRSNIAGLNAVVVGRSLLVGRSVATLLSYSDATVTLAHSKTKNLKEICRQADILVTAIGVPHFFDKDFIKPGAIIIDVGISRLNDGRVVGDIDFESARDVAGFITPVPGGVGPMTIAYLLKNTLQAALPN